MIFNKTVVFVASTDIANALPANMLLTGDFFTLEETAEDRRQRKERRVNGEVTNHYETSDESQAVSAGDSGFRARLEFVEQHLEHIHSDPLRILHRGDTASRQWGIETTALSRLLRDREFYRIIKERHGDIAHRLLRIIVDRGKLDEKQVCISQ